MEPEILIPLQKLDEEKEPTQQNVGSQALVLTDTLSAYMHTVNQYPILTREEELELARKWNEEGDPLAAQQLVTSNLRFVVKIAHEYTKYGFNITDLIQEGNIGLMQAVKKFNPDSGYRLISYAVYWIRGMIMAFILRNWSLVKIGTTQLQRKLFYSISKIKEQLGIGEENETELDTGTKRLAAHLHTSEQEIIDIENRIHQRDYSMNSPMETDSDETFLNRLADDAASPSDIVEQNELEFKVKRRIRKVWPQLNDRERFILRHRLYTNEPLTMQEIGERYGITRERIRQIEERLKKKLQEDFSDLQ
jgi:RNA polymerase sigma-32 factor